VKKKVVLLEADPQYLFRVGEFRDGFCPGCQGPVDGPCVTFENHEWHHQCFKCGYCKKIIDKSECILKDNILFHRECYSRLYVDRCANCGEMVDSSSCIRLNGVVYHLSCFSCTKCGDTESIKKRCMVLFGNPYCLNCYQNLSSYLHKCFRCKNAIIPDGDEKHCFVQGKKLFFHSNCYSCSVCKSELSITESHVNDDMIVCANCYKNSKTKICSKCNLPIYGQNILHNKCYYHPNHFQCCSCSENLKINTVVVIEGELFCRKCSANVFDSCHGCGKHDEGVCYTACGYKWHKECLVCLNCGVNVLQEKYVSIDHKPCCEKCYIDLKSKNIINKWNMFVGSNP